MNDPYNKGEKPPHDTIGQTVCFSDYCEQWLVAIQTRYKPSTCAKYRNQIRKHILPQLGSYCSGTLGEKELEMFRQYLLYQCGLSSKTAKDVLILLNMLLRYAGKIDPAYLTLHLTYPKVLRTESRTLTRAEQYRLVNYLQENMDCCKFGVLLSLLGGLRIGEICALKWSDVSIHEECIRIRMTMQRIQSDGGGPSKTKVIITSPKSMSSVRSIPMTPLAVELCRQMQPTDPESYLLTGTRSYMEPRTLQYRMKKYTEACQLQGVHFHTLRHTFATRCMEVGVEMKVLSEVLGHSNISTTLDRYVHASFDIKKENIQKLRMLGL